jgi:hypothetical protein
MIANEPKKSSARRTVKPEKTAIIVRRNSIIGGLPDGMQFQSKREEENNDNIVASTFTF